MRRREFLTGLSAAALAGTTADRADASTGQQALTARVANLQLAPQGYPETEIWGYDGLVPGPVIRAKQGSRVVRRFVNELPQPSSVHWHGIRIANPMDGVPGLTQDAVPEGGSFDYDFVAPDAGTYWYHAHAQPVEQVARGLYGALIVEEPDAPEIDLDEILIIDDWLLDPKTATIDPDFASPHDRSHAGRRGNYVVTSGRSDFSLPVQQHARLRLRLINAANASIFRLALDGLDGWKLAEDGMPLATPEAVAGPFLLAPGQRIDLAVDVVADPGEPAHLVRFEDDQGYAQAIFPVTGRASVARRPAPPPLPPNPRMDIPGLADARRVVLNMQGGAMGRLDAAILNGTRKSFRQLVRANQFWSMNGVIGLTDTPLADLDQGENMRLEIRNDSVFPHAMHLHGLHFREVRQDGSLGPLRDTLLMFGDETREIAFVADNPGKWLFHCHMLSHTAAGMATWIRIT